MVKSIIVTNHLGERVKINLNEENPDHGMLIKSIKGLGPAKANINTSELVTDDGSVFNSSRLEKRNIVLELVFTEAPKIEDARLNSYKFFPIRNYIEFLVETDNLIAKTIGYIESNEPNIFSELESSQISIICPDPFFHSDKGTTISFIYAVEPLFEFEFENDSLTENMIEFSSVETEREKEVIYDGNYDVGMIMTIHALGNVKNVTVYNVKTRESIYIDTEKMAAITGNGMKAGDDIIINTIRGEKSVYLYREGQRYNILNCVSKDSDWFRLTKGSNILAFSAVEGADNLVFKLEHDVLYDGV